MNQRTHKERYWCLHELMHYIVLGTNLLTHIPRFIWIFFHPEDGLSKGRKRWISESSHHFFTAWPSQCNFREPHGVFLSHTPGSEPGKLIRISKTLLALEQHVFELQGPLGTQYNAVHVFSPPYDFLNNIFSLACFILRIYYIRHTQNMC